MLRPFGPYTFCYISPVARFACALLLLRLKPPPHIYYLHLLFFPISSQKEIFPCDRSVASVIVTSYYSHHLKPTNRTATRTNIFSHDFFTRDSNPYCSCHYSAVVILNTIAPRDFYFFSSRNWPEEKLSFKWQQ